jgi:hypothetical protein
MLHANLRMVLSLPQDRVDALPYEAFLGIQPLVDYLAATSPVAADFKIAIRRTTHLALCGTFSDVLRRISALFRSSPATGHHGRCTFLGEWHKGLVAEKARVESTVEPSHPLAQLG